MCNMSELISSSSSSQDAKMLNSCNEHVQQAAQYLCEGKLVAFPTETVYGLGANAFDEKAVRSIFTAKGRPLTDPLIVHIPHIKAAIKLADISDQEMSLFELLGTALWPGPLTMIVKAVDVLPLCVTANTGYVGLRVPNHPLALRLLEACKLPVCAPSANRFGHVSPTKASHVFDDLGRGRNVAAIISGEMEVGGDCMHGIESTVVKANIATKEVQLYRQGAISQKRLEEILENADNVAKLGGIQWTVKVVSRIVHMTASDPAPAAAPSSGSVGQEAPGQAVTHYAPDNAVCVMSKVVNLTGGHSSGNSTGTGTGTGTGNSTTGDDSELVDWNITPSGLRSAVIIDFGGQWERLLARQTAVSLGLGVLAYRDLSASGSYREAARSLFDTLRWAETIPNVQTIILAPVLENMRIYEAVAGDVDADASLERLQLGVSSADVDIKCALYDRQFRATSGKMVQLHLKSIDV